MYSGFTLVGKGLCRGEQDGKYPKYYMKSKMALSKCQGKCASLGSCASFTFGIRQCILYGTGLPSAISGDDWTLHPGNGGTDAVTGVAPNEIYLCYKKTADTSGQNLFLLFCPQCARVCVLSPSIC